jgi:hypothetical protein
VQILDKQLCTFSTGYLQSLDKQQCRKERRFWIISCVENTVCRVWRSSCVENAVCRVWISSFIEKTVCRILISCCVGNTFTLLYHNLLAKQYSGTTIQRRHSFFEYFFLKNTIHISPVATRTYRLLISLAT